MKKPTRPPKKQSKQSTKQESPRIFFSKGSEESPTFKDSFSSNKCNYNLLFLQQMQLQSRKNKESEDKSASGKSK
jgi:hypothetical protein